MEGSKQKICIETIKSKKIFLKSRMTKTEVYSGPSTLGLLGVAFVVLKLLHIIEWSWWWVLAPFWAPLALVAIILIIIGIVIVATCAKSVK